MAKNEKEYSPSDKARRFTLGSIARIGACFYLIYIIYSLVKGAASGEMDIPMPVVIVIIAVFAVVGAFLIYVTVKEVVRGVANKEYSMHKYYAEELTAQGLKYNSKGELVPIDTPDDDEEDEESEEEEYEDETEEEYEADYDEEEAEAESDTEE